MFKLASFLYLIVFSLLASSNTKAPLLLGFSHFPPYAIEDGVSIVSPKLKHCEAANYTGYGIDVDFLSEVVRNAGMDYVIRFFPQARLALGLDNIGVDLTAGIFYSEKSGEARYQYQLYDIGGATAFVAHQSIAKTINSFSNIKEHVIGAVRAEYFHDDTVHTWIRNKNNKQVVTANDYPHLFRMLEAQRVDVIAVNDVLGSYMLSIADRESLEFTPYQIPYGQDPEKDGIYIGGAKSLDANTFQMLQRSTKRLLETNILACIKRRYGVEKSVN